MEISAGTETEMKIDSTNAKTLSIPERTGSMHDKNHDLAKTREQAHTHTHAHNKSILTHTHTIAPDLLIRNVVGDVALLLSLV